MLVYIVIFLSIFLLYKYCIIPLSDKIQKIEDRIDLIEYGKKEDNTDSERTGQE